MWRYLTLVLVLFTYSEAKKLPSYLKACKEDDPNLGKCVVESTRAAIPSIINGDRKYNIPVLDPLVVEKAEIPGNGLSLTFTDVKLHGIRDVKIQDIQFDPKKQHVSADFTIPRLYVDSNYNIDGKILVLPIKGDGRANITLIDLNLMYNTDFVKEKDASGDEHLKVSEPNFKYKVSRAYFKMDNLFNGDKTLGDATHKFFDDNWEEVVKEMAPAILQVVEEISTRILTGVSENVPYKEFWAN